jgi:hypothetical protein
MTSVYDDGKYVISASALSTPTRLYPLEHTTARLRRDPLWLAIAMTAICSAALAAYADLLTDTEILVCAALPAVLLIVGLNMGILALDAPGHQRIVIAMGVRRAQKIFRALRDARLAETRQPQVNLTSEGGSGN